MIQFAFLLKPHQQDLKFFARLLHVTIFEVTDDFDRHGFFPINAWILFFSFLSIVLDKESDGL